MEPQVQYEKYLKLSYYYLSIRNRSEKEMRDYLVKKKAPEHIIERIITSLWDHKFLNDEAFARSWVLSRARIKPKGKALLKIELRQKELMTRLFKKF